MTDSAYKFPERRSQSGSAERNSKPIADTLCPLLSKWFSTIQRDARLLEIGSGEGEQLAAIVKGLQQKNDHSHKITIQPTEADPQGCEDVDKRCNDLNSEHICINACHCLDIDREEDWKLLAGDGFDVVMLFNIVHIIPFLTVQNLFKHFGNQSPSVLNPTQGRIILYGAFDEEGKTRSEGNEKFDVYLKQKDNRFGLRNIQTDLEPLAKQSSLFLEEKIEMPSGNVSVDDAKENECEC
ncbi:uncharacterized protein FA14DRAFT_161130 [Meira miltonrushii]|uniref:DUF938-domain-containing protein n=1 Tax=Meira miltonrushii TaxID=1280837 RepID=A0A316VFU2_9BASI|nr:uncharacterized protein FA14DRAFT_161130 [Meira miltonrushii]PWN36400.1 hypothetical protein FA14DRAFT_161130 [Meira miltonrushii]